MNKLFPQTVLDAQGLKQRWVAGQMGIQEALLSRLLSGERDWTPETRRLFALAVGMREDMIAFERVLES